MKNHGDGRREPREKSSYIHQPRSASEIARSRHAKIPAVVQVSFLSFYSFHSTKIAAQSSAFYDDVGGIITG